MSGISGLGSIAQTWLTQKTNGANGIKSGDSDDLSVSGTNGSQQAGGAFMQDVMQSLQSLGLNLSGASPSSPLTTASNTTPNVSATPSDVGHALHTFMHDLHQSLRHSGAAQQQESSTTDSNALSSVKNGYNDFASNLQSLIGSLNNTSGTPATTSTDPTLQNSVNNVAGATGTNPSKLQTDFSNLLSAIGSGSGSTSSTTPTLQDFLNKMVSNVSKTGQSGAGSIFSAQV